MSFDDSPFFTVGGTRIVIRALSPKKGRVPVIEKPGRILIPPARSFTTAVRMLKAITAWHSAISLDSLQLL
jgi:hypothetical protein